MPKRRSGRSRTQSPAATSDAYRRYQLAEGKRYDRALSTIDNIEAVVGRERDAYAIDITIYREVLAEGRATQAADEAALRLDAARDDAKADGIITHHPLGDMRLPTVKKSDDPVT